MKKPLNIAPNHFLQTALTKLGFHVRCLWQAKGGKLDGWAWLECLQITGGPNDLRRDSGAPHATVIVQTFNENDGWEAYIASPSNSTAATIGDVMRAAGADPLKHAGDVQAAIAK